MVISAAPPSYTWVRREHGGTHLNPPPPYQPRSPSPEQGEYRGDGIYALVKFSYRANSNEFNENLAHGEIISQIDKVSEGWWAGTNSGGERGLFPSNFVSEIEEIDETAPAVPQTPTATAIYDYEAVEDNEIGFPDGAKIANIVSPGQLIQLPPEFARNR